VVLVVAETPLPPTGLQNFGTLDDSPPVLEPLEPTSEVEAALERARDTVEAAGLKADLAWSVGDPSAEIVATARDQHADQVVLGEHHHSALGRFFGSDVAGDVEKELGSELVVLE
jgi:nucleotide-binding universal stress UspA family protein